MSLTEGRLTRADLLKAGGGGGARASRFARPAFGRAIEARERPR